MSIQQIETGIQALKSRRNRIMFFATLSFAILIFSVISLFIQQDFVYQWFGLSEKVQQLHIPVVVENLRASIDQPDYFVNLFAWFGWLFLKLTVSFVGAFFCISILKKISFFRIRFQSFILKLVGWLISFIIIWSVLAYVQYDMKSDDNAQIQDLVTYQQHIQQSQLYRYLQENEPNQTVQAYLLTQAALMHKKDDRGTAVAYNTKLMQAEKTDPHFLEYGFKPEQLWTIQHQLYAESKTEIAKSVDEKVGQAQVWSERIQYMVAITSVIFAVLSFVLYGLGRRLSSRVDKIRRQLEF